ncbi:MAG: hypothetical protein ACLTYW_06130 [Collinsella sp.]
MADMNFATVPTVQEHIIQRASTPCLAISIRAEYFDRIIEWQSRRTASRLALAYRLRKRRAGRCRVDAAAYVQPGDAVLVHSPTYIGFTKSIEAAAIYCPQPA